MIQLSFSCYCSELKVHPKNWSNPKPSIKKDWYIYYRFYDPTFVINPKYKKGKLVFLKGMNHYKSISERKCNTHRMLYGDKFI